METIIGIENLKDQYRKAKLMCGDLRGLKNRFDLSEKLGINSLQTYYNSVSTHGGERFELVANCTEQGTGSNVNEYTMKDLIEPMKKWPGVYEVELECLTWNKRRTDARRRTVLNFIFKNK